MDNLFIEKRLLRFSNMAVQNLDCIATQILL